MASLQSHLENLRSKPEHIRHRIAFWSALGVTAVIFVFWLASFTATITGNVNPVTAAVSKAGTPAQSLIAGVGGLFTDIRDLIFGPKKIVYPSVEARPGN